MSGEKGSLSRRWSQVLEGENINVAHSYGCEFALCPTLALNLTLEYKLRLQMHYTILMCVQLVHLCAKCKNTIKYIKYQNSDFGFKCEILFMCEFVREEEK